jgi:hypothetical protein
MSSVIALVLAVAGTFGALLLPLYDVNVTHSIGRVNMTEQYRIKPVNTPAKTPIIMIATLCVILTTTAVIARKLQTAMGVCLLAVSLVGAMSIGLFYLPSAVALLSPAASRWRR